MLRHVEGLIREVMTEVMMSDKNAQECDATTAV
jgi:hypothetical protein